MIKYYSDTKVKSLTVLIFILSLISIKMKGQVIETTIYDSVQVTYQPAEDKKLDSLVSVKDWNKKNMEWKIFFDSNKKKLAYFSSIIADTCTRTNYWRNGKIKDKAIYVKSNEGDFRWWCQESYCENGQLIVKHCPHIDFIEDQLLTRYYCNGKKDLEYTQHGNTAIGNFTKWYEDGTTQFINHFDENGPSGEWKFWDEKGNLKKVETYKDGSLIDTKEF